MRDLGLNSSRPSQTVVVKCIGIGIGIGIGFGIWHWLWHWLWHLAFGIGFGFGSRVEIGTTGQRKQAVARSAIKIDQAGGLIE